MKNYNLELYLLLNKAEITFSKSSGSYIYKLSLHIYMHVYYQCHLIYEFMFSFVFQLTRMSEIWDAISYTCLVQDYMYLVGAQ